jgi:hypothetical protein
VVAAFKGVPAGRPVLFAVTLAAVCGSAGVLSGARLWGVVGAALPEPVPPVLRAAAGGLATLVGGGAMLLAGSLVAHLGRVDALARALNGGASGAAGLGLLLASVAALPSAAVWAAAFAVGPGFAVGVGTSVAPAGVLLGPVPALPLLGALPGPGAAPSASLLALAIAPLAGVVVGLLTCHRPADTVSRTAVEALAAGVLAGAGLGLLAALSAGSVGAGRLAQLGPDPWKVAVAASLEVGATAALVAWEACRHGSAVMALVRRGWAAAHALRTAR